MITDIRLQHFRSYVDETFEFAPGVNIIVGPNASGKTNLLEAVLVIARGTSYRVRDADLVAYDEPWARLDAHTSSVYIDESGDDVSGGLNTAPNIQAGDAMPRTLKIVASQSGLGGVAPQKTYEIDGKSFRRLHPSRMLPVVVFEPNHLYMLSGTPELRRSYLDEILEQTEPGYAVLRKDYKRVLAQRNALLKTQGMSAEPQMFPWNIRLSQLGGRLAQYRMRLVARIDAEASDLYSSLARAPIEVAVQYETRLPAYTYDSALLRSLEANFSLDVARGYTGTGPHRDDIKVLLRGRNAQTSASRGENRTAVLMLKVMELRLLQDARGVSPLLLLDDVFSELDGARRQALTAYLHDYQTFITTTDADVVVRHFMDKCRIIPLG